MSRSRLTQNALLLFAGTALGNLFSFLFQALVAREFGSAAYGTFTLATSVLLFVVMFVMLGFQDALIKFVGEIDEAPRLSGTIRAGIGLPLSISLLGAGALYLVAEPLSLLVFGSPAVARFLEIVAFALPGAVLVRLSSATLMGFERAGQRIFAEEVVRGGALFVGVALVAALSYPFASVGVVYVLSFWLAGLVAVVLLVRIASTRLLASPEYDIRGMLTFSLPLLLSSQAGFLSNWIDTILVGVITNSESLVGIYQSAFVLATSVLIFMGSITGSLYPNFSALVSRDETEKLVSRYRDGARWGVAFTAAPVFYLVFFSSTSLDVIFGPEFTTGGAALAVIAIGNLAGVAVGPGTELVKSLGESRFVFASELLALVVNALLNVLLIPVVGIVGAAVGTAVGAIVANGAHFIRARRRLPLDVPVLPLAKTAVAGIGASAVSSQVIDLVRGVPTLAVHVGIFSVLYVSFLYLVRGFSREDVRDAVRMIRA